MRWRETFTVICHLCFSVLVRVDAATVTQIRNHEITKSRNRKCGNSGNSGNSEFGIRGNFETENGERLSHSHSLPPTSHSLPLTHLFVYPSFTVLQYRVLVLGTWYYGIEIEVVNERRQRRFVVVVVRSSVPSFLRSVAPSFVPSFLRSFVPSFLRSFVF